MKIVFKKSSLSAFLLLFTVLAGLLFHGMYPFSVYASEDGKNQYVYDNYGLFSEKEVNELTDTCLKYGKEAQADIIMVTTNNLDGKSTTDYLEEFYDEKIFGQDERSDSTVIMLIYLGEDRRTVDIQGYGNAENYINNDRIEHIIDDLSPVLKEGNYKKAFVEFAKEAAYYMNEKKGVSETPATGNSSSGDYGNSSYNGPSNYYGEKVKSPFYNTFVQLGIALLIGAVSVAVMAFNSGGRMTVQGRDYLDNGSSGILEKGDDYLRTTTTRTKKPSQDSGAGDGPRSSGGGGVSPGGHSHSGGSRDF